MPLPRELIGVEDDGKGTVVVNLDQHHGPKFAGLHTPDASLPQSLGKAVDQRRGEVGLGRVNKTGPPPLPAVGVQRELGDHQGIPIHIEDG